jgi:hypothetical protein
MPEVSEIRSNLKRSTRSYDEEMALPQEYLDKVAAMPVSDRLPNAEEQDAIDAGNVALYDQAGERRMGHQRRFMGKENEAMRLVNIMHPHKIFRRLRRAGVDARIEAPHFYVWMPDDVTGRLISLKRERSVGRLWLHDDAIVGRVGISAWVWDAKTKKRERRMVTTLQWPYGPEWSLLHFDEFDVPVTEKYRGWRTAMMHLIEHDVLTEEEVNKAFGPVTLSPVSLIYREHLYRHRQKRMGLIA